MGGTGVASHVGLHALGYFADRLGLGDALSSAIPQRPTLLHDRGKVLVEAALVLAGGGESCADIEHLRVGGGAVRVRRLGLDAEPQLSRDQREDAGRDRYQGGKRAGTGVGAFGGDEDGARSSWTSTPRSSRSTPRTKSKRRRPTRVGSVSTRCSASQTRPVRHWRECSGRAMPARTPPLTTCWSSTRRSLQLPVDVQAGHHVGDDASLVRREIVCRTDSGGTTAAFTAALRARNIGFLHERHDQRPGPGRHLRCRRDRGGLGAGARQGR